VISKQKMTQNTNHYLWFVITSQNTFVISKRAHYTFDGLICKFLYGKHLLLSRERRMYDSRAFWAISCDMRHAALVLAVVRGRALEVGGD
jgi:hypothetical protein